MNAYSSVARYFFHLSDDSGRIRDEDGSELPDIRAAHLEGVLCLSEALKSRASGFCSSTGLELIVMNEEGLILYILNAMCTTAPVCEGVILAQSAERGRATPT